ncbi:hypothetical protein L593_05315 [Salinarchaeum sp. Harcht-Bsk1]|uniref:hypothetical protein n=1 Tax=Salinarchaeum sp. Harcht-Bsk1 TaxID=1333523 RepID=UPI0003423A96|nr:hypothetical protein [Salinarchaeum sp. Harcht-Bsk1]AGN01012.1 hypothetical protein L593_05315 [Salinarchaeum sp. Harcht-Bsk1]
MVETCYVTGGLLDALLAIAGDREPDAVSTLLVVSRAGELDELPASEDDDLDPETPVFTDLYFPSAGRSVDAVFGMDVSVPHGQAQGRFVSHPLGELSVSNTDDLHEVVLVAVPPWTREDVAAFDRSGRRLELRIVAAAPPEQPFEG